MYEEVCLNIVGHMFQ